MRVDGEGRYPGATGRTWSTSLTAIGVGPDAQPCARLVLASVAVPSGPMFSHMVPV